MIPSVTAAKPYCVLTSITMTTVTVHIGSDTKWYKPFLKWSLNRFGYSLVKTCYVRTYYLHWAGICHRYTHTSDCVFYSPCHIANSEWKINISPKVHLNFLNGNGLVFCNRLQLKRYLFLLFSQFVKLLLPNVQPYWDTVVTGVQQRFKLREIWVESYSPGL